MIQIVKQIFNTDLIELEATNIINGKVKEPKPQNTQKDTLRKKKRLHLGN